MPRARAPLAAPHPRTSARGRSRREIGVSVVPEEVFQIRLRELLGAAHVLAEHGAREIPLLAAELEDFLLDRALGDEAVRGDDLRLPDAVRAVRRLVFDGWVPP